MMGGVFDFKGTSARTPTYVSVFERGVLFYVHPSCENINNKQQQKSGMLSRSIAPNQTSTLHWWFISVTVLASLVAHGLLIPCYEPGPTYSQVGLIFFGILHCFSCYVDPKKNAHGNRLSVRQGLATACKFQLHAPHEELRARSCWAAKPSLDAGQLDAGQWFAGR